MVVLANSILRNWVLFSYPYVELTLISAQDLNGDGALDLVVGIFQDNVSLMIFMGEGNGTFRPTLALPVGFRPVNVGVRDLNGDGLLDIAVANWEYNDVAVLTGRGDGTFHAAAFFGTDARPTALRIGDLNGDGWPDMVVVNETRSVSVLLNSTPSLGG